MKRANYVKLMVVLFVIMLTGFSFYGPSQTEKVADVELSHHSNDTWDVLISTYMRSGSTFLGQILGWRHDSFYMYEPLRTPHVWQFFREDGRLCSYLRPTCPANDTYARTSLKRARDFLKDFYHCRLAIHSDFVNEKIQATSHFAGPSWGPFRTCRKQKRSVQQCLSELEPICQTAIHRVTKVLRMDFLYMDEFLRVLPRLKVVLLLRDPRGILNSHLRSEWHPMSLTVFKVFENDVKVVCSRIERDLQAAVMLMKHFHDRAKIVQYEDLAKTSESVNSLYRFMGMRQLDDNMVVMNDFKFSKIKNKSRQIDPFSYRSTMSWNVVTTIDKYCSNLYKKLGLVKYRNLKHLRNREFPSISGKLPYALL